jgi:anaerobic magnesium-protoporphyrin IX monomethyl ester cyclase
MKIVCIIPSDNVVAEPLIYPPIGLLYIASTLENAGHEVSVYDMRDAGNTIDKIDDADAYAFTIGIPQSKAAIEDALYLRGKGKYVVVGGHYPSWCSDRIPTGINAVVIGEGEDVIVGIVEGRKEGIFRGGKGNVSSFPFPARHLLSDEKVFNTRIMAGYGNVGQERSTTMICSRGCPRRCSFCSNIPQKIRTK